MTSTVIDKKTTKARQANHSPKYNVILWNDDVTPMDIVMACLVMIVGLNEQKAYQVMMTAHNEGKAVAKTCELEHAEFYKAQLVNKKLTATIEEA